MGGGGMIRAVGKVSGIGAAANRVLRGAPTTPPVEHAARGVSRNVASISTSQSGKIPGGDATPMVAQIPAWELDDWEFSGSEGDLVMSSGEPLPRVVFGAVPSFQEAKEATDELKDALEKVYLSPPVAAESGASLSASQVSDQNPLSSFDVEKKYIVTTESAIAPPPAPKHAVQAFKLLTQSAAAQNVVASIASDPNVWNAVLHNEALMDFLHSQKAEAAVGFPCEELDVRRTVEDAMFQNLESTKNIDEIFSDGGSGTAENGFMKVLKDIKFAVEEMVSNVSCFLQNIFNNPNGEEKKGAGEGGSDGSTRRETLGASFFGLAVLAIIVVLLKRPI